MLFMLWEKIFQTVGVCFSLVRDHLIQMYAMFSINQLIVIGAKTKKYTMRFVCLATGATVRSI